MIKNFTKKVLFIACFVFGISYSNQMNTSGHVGLARTLTVETYGVGSFNAGSTIKWDADGEYVIGLDAYDSVLNYRTHRLYLRELSQLYSFDMYFLYGLSNAWDVSMNLPIYHDRTGWGRNITQLGSLEINTKLRYPFDQSQLPFNQAYFLKVILPTSSKDHLYFPRHAYNISDEESNTYATFATDQVIVQPMMIWSLFLNRMNPRLPLAIHVNFGGAIHRVTALVAAVGVEYTVSPGTTAYIEFSGESRINHYINQFSVGSVNDDVLLLSPGIHTKWQNGMNANLAFDFGLSDYAKRTKWHNNNFEYATKGSPIFGVQLTVGWSGLAKQQDSDGDGITNERDVCPQIAEDFDRFQDNDGCPENDNDNDGIPDHLDQCPMLFVKVDGCPVNDKDGDKIFDFNDQCPDQAEDYDGYMDTDGCPDLDNDNDGVNDISDRCPNRSEDMDGYDDADGCPDLDNDNDGLVDSLDACPRDKGYPVNKGCPSKKIKEKMILKGVGFLHKSSKLSSESFKVLDDVIESLLEIPTAKIEVQGYTDNDGDDDANLLLSQKRAESVVVYMISKGIPVQNLTAIGFGEKNPIADNKTTEGKEKNRRVELRILE